MEGTDTTRTATAPAAAAVVGLLLAPIVLRRMIRGESGSKVTAARERLLTQGY